MVNRKYQFFYNDLRLKDIKELKKKERIHTKGNERKKKWLSIEMFVDTALCSSICSCFSRTKAPGSFLKENPKEIRSALLKRVSLV